MSTLVAASSVASASPGPIGKTSTFLALKKANKITKGAKSARERSEAMLREAIATTGEMRAESSSMESTRRKKLLEQQSQNINLFGETSRTGRSRLLS